MRSSLAAAARRPQNDARYGGTQTRLSRRARAAIGSARDKARYPGDGHEEARAAKRPAVLGVVARVVDGEHEHLVQGLNHPLKAPTAHLHTEPNLRATVQLRDRAAVGLSS
jgi:hypothetical protein